MGNVDVQRLGGADRLGRLQREAAGEDRQPPEERPRVGREQVVAPGDRVAHRAQPRRRVARSADQQRQPSLQPRQQGGRGEELHPGGGQFDRQWQPIQPAADLRHGPGVVLGYGEGGQDGARPLRRTSATASDRSTSWLGTWPSGAVNRATVGRRQ